MGRYIIYGYTALGKSKKGYPQDLPLTGTRKIFASVYIWGSLFNRADSFSFSHTL